MSYNMLIAKMNHVLPYPVCPRKKVNIPLMSWIVHEALNNCIYKLFVCLLVHIHFVQQECNSKHFCCFCFLFFFFCLNSNNWKMLIGGGGIHWKEGGGKFHYSPFFWSALYFPILININIKYEYVCF